jgi:hypothetical protein
LTGLPRQLLHSLSGTLGVNALAIQVASLKTLYSRPATRFEHQRWARDYAGLKTLGPEDQQKFNAVLALLSNSAVSTQDLVKSAEVWLFEVDLFSMS